MKRMKKMPSQKDKQQTRFVREERSTREAERWVPLSRTPKQYNIYFDSVSVLFSVRLSVICIGRSAYLPTNQSSQLPVKGNLTTQM